MRKIITIGREFGSGGRELGKRLAEELNIAYYDKEIITAIASKSGMAEEYVSNVVENHITSYYPIIVGQSFSYPYEMEPRTSVMATQTQIIEEFAQKSDCVIIGRCADYILRDSHPFKIFVYADIDYRVDRCREKEPKNEHLTDAELKKKILGIDKSRAKYYEYYTGCKWGDKSNYTLCINTTGREIKSLVPALSHYLKSL